MKIHWKINMIEIIVPLISWLDFVICGFIKNFLPNSYLILQIHHAKSFKMRHVTSLCFKLSGPLDFQYAPLTYSLCLQPYEVEFLHPSISDEGWNWYLFMSKHINSCFFYFSAVVRHLWTLNIGPTLGISCLWDFSYQ